MTTMMVRDLTDLEMEAVSGGMENVDPALEGLRAFQDSILRNIDTGAAIDLIAGGGTTRENEARRQAQIARERAAGGPSASQLLGRASSLLRLIRRRY